MAVSFFFNNLDINDFTIILLLKKCLIHKFKEIRIGQINLSGVYVLFIYLKIKDKIYLFKKIKN